MKRRLLLLALAAVPFPAQSLPGLSGFLEARRNDWNIPGLAVAVVERGKVVHLEASGLRDVEKNLPVTRDTLFGIGSITKSITVLALSTLVEDGKLGWDRPVRDSVPGFRLLDPVLSDRVTLRDLVSHRTGLPRHDAAWAGASLSREDLFSRLRFFEPTKDLRAAFQYNNLMYMAAGVVAEKLTGRSWEALVRERVFQPLKWTQANFSVSEFDRTDNWARNYDWRDEKWVETPPRILDAIGPAGSINATLAEMIRYLRLHLADGELDGRRLFPASIFERMREAQIATDPVDVPGEKKTEQAYGLGLFLTSHRGRRFVHHTGTIGGYHAILAYLPEERIGVITLQNRVVRQVPQIIVREVFDRLLGVTPPDWQARYKEQEREQRAKEKSEREALQAQRKTGTRPSHDLGDYAGVYRHPGYGEIRVESAPQGLSARFNGESRPLDHWHYEVFTWGPQQRMRFVTDTAGAVSELHVKIEPALDRETVFRRSAS